MLRRRRRRGRIGFGSLAAADAVEERVQKHCAAKVVPIISGSRIPRPGKPRHCTNMAGPLGKQRGTDQQGYILWRQFQRAADDQGQGDRPAYITSTLQAERQQARDRQQLVDWVS